MKPLPNIIAGLAVNTWFARSPSNLSENPARAIPSEEVEARKSTPPARANRKSARAFHRILGSVLGVFTVYIAITGLLIQFADLHAILSGKPETDPAMAAIRESINGTPNFEVIKPTDYAAPALPQNFDYDKAFALLVRSADSAAGANAPLKYLELRVLDGKPVAIAQAGERTLRFNAETGESLASPGRPPRTGPNSSLHARAKSWHRMSLLSGAAGDIAELFNALIGIALFFVIVIGLILYFQLLRARRRAGLNAVFWSAGGRWRSLHRWISIVAAAFLMIVSVSGFLLSIDTVALGLYGVTHTNAGRYSRFPYGMIGDLSSPLSDSEVPGMLHTTLSSYRAAEGTTPIKVIRLRYFSGMPQGVVLTGGEATRQLVFNAQTGKPASMTEPGYPYSGFPFGWREHEFMKKIHRGDALGIPGRLMDVFAGLSLLFLSASGLYMYADLWLRRRRAGRSQLFWS